MQIKELFDGSKDIYRTIEKVITYGASQEQKLKSEISEYVVTESIEEQFERLLEKMQSAMDAGGSNEVGVWVSGFYGSGKSSFTKYLGFALDDSIQIDGIPFIKHLQDRFTKQTTKQLLATVAKRFPAAVVMLDLASTQLAGASMEEVSQILYYKILDWAGYSKNLKIASFERRLKKDGRYEEFLEMFSDEYGGEDWADFRNDPLISEQAVPSIAHKMYPNIIKSEQSFNADSSDWVVFTDQLVQEMIDITKEHSKKEYVIFIVDEVGQYVGSKQSLILNLQGLAENLKKIGDGEVWFLGTAQQRLTEDEESAALNSQQLYKLKDRFPIQVDLKANDIKEICYRRLLAKSPAGEDQLNGLFDSHGQSLRHHTKLEDARAYGADFDKQTFVNLYPFLPAHFDILLHLLAALAKSTGGIGLRSAIKVIQDVLVEGSEVSKPIADQNVGWIANTVTLYDALKKDIETAFPQYAKAVWKVVGNRFADPIKHKLHQDVAKTIAVLQILNNLPITLQNVASLMHAGVADASKFEDVKLVVEELIQDPIVPLGEKDGRLAFHSEKLNEIEQERSTIALRAIELQRIRNESLRDAYSLPSTHLSGGLSVSSGLKSQTISGQISTLSGDKYPIQTIVEMVEPSSYEAGKARLTEESRQNSSRQSIFLIGQISPEMDEKASEIFRSREIVNKHRNDPDQEIKEYCNGQIDRATRLTNELQRLIKRSLIQGSFIFKGEVTAVESFSQDLGDAAKKHLSGVAEQVFDRYGEAPERAKTDLAEKFLRAGGLNGITASIDPLGLVQTSGGQPSINVGHKAIVSIRDSIERQGLIEGKRLLEIFSSAPFGWSQDTLRYLVAAMLVAGEIKLKIAGREVLVNGDLAIDGLKTNNAFKSVGVSLREEKPSTEVLAKAAQRLTDLSGETVIPLEDEISKATTGLFPSLQQAYGPLGEKLKALKVPGSERLTSLSDQITKVLSTDASDAPQKLGADDSELFNDLKWAAEIKRSLDQGLESTISELQAYLGELKRLPDTGIPGQLKKDLEETTGAIEERLNQDDFSKHATDFSSGVTQISNKINESVTSLHMQQKQRLKDVGEDLSLVDGWSELTLQEQNNLIESLQSLVIELQGEISDLSVLVNQEFSIQNEINQVKAKIKQTGESRIKEKVNEERAKLDAEGKKTIDRSFATKKQITTLSELDELIRNLQSLRGELQYAQDFVLNIKHSEDK